MTFQRFWTLESRLQYHLAAFWWSIWDPCPEMGACRPYSCPKTFSSLLALEGIGVTLKEARKHDLTNVVHSLRDHRVLPLSVLATRIFSSISLFSCWRDSVLMDASARNDLLCDVRILHAWCIFSNQQI